MTRLPLALGAATLVAFAAALGACQTPDPVAVAPDDLKSALDACIRGDQTGTLSPADLGALTDEGRASLDGLTLGIARFDSLDAAHPGNADVLGLRGQCRAIRFAADSVMADARGAFNDFSAALAVMEAAPDAADRFQISPDRLYYWRAFVVQPLNPDDWRPSLADFDRAVAAAPRNPVYVRDRGVARVMAGDTAGAREDLRRFVALAPGDSVQADDLRALLGDSLAGRPPTPPRLPAAP